MNAATINAGSERPITAPTNSPIEKAARRRPMTGRVQHQIAEGRAVPRLAAASRTNAASAASATATVMTTRIGATWRISH